MTAVTVPDQKPAYLTMLEKHIPTFADFLPEGVKPERVIASVRMAVAGNPKIAECSVGSIVQSVGRAMQLDLEVGVNAYLIPRNTWNPATKQKEMTCTMLPDYRAYIEMVVRSGAARAVETGIVREGDHFVYKKGLEKVLDHVPQSTTSAKITHAYAIVRLRYGLADFVVLTREEIEAIRAKSQGWSDAALEKKREPIGLESVPWYGPKSAVIRVTNLVPKNPRLAKWLAAAEGVVDGAYEVLPNDLPAIQSGTASHPAPLKRLGDTGYEEVPEEPEVDFDPETGEVR